MPVGFETKPSGVSNEVEDDLGGHFSKHMMASMRRTF